ncbi:MAG TPA: hypothetical protein VMM76_13870 [Pirellulaceae bacterium]|nr:hypothetical protein [Pirellulaceae bacterium]
MSRIPRIVCECGGELPRPLPHVCPHCGAVISSVRRSATPLIVQLIVVTATFAALVGFLAWLLLR